MSFLIPIAFPVVLPMVKSFFIFAAVRRQAGEDRGSCGLRFFVNALSKNSG